ncbi:MAG: efflux transporter outer membrane subunit [Burkholderiaceae bacterium]
MTQPLMTSPRARARAGRTSPLRLSKAWALGAVLLVGGCAGVRPPLPDAARVTAPAGWRTADAGTAPISATWWEAFGDPQLTRVVETALANNADVQIAAARILEAMAQARYASAQQGPNVVAGVGVVRERDVNPGFGVPEEQTASESILSASFDADLFGRLASASKAARASLLATRAARANVQLGVAAGSARAYLTLRSLDLRLAILRKTLDARQQSLQIMRRRASVGYSSQLEVAQAEVEVRSTEQLIPTTQLAIRRTEDALNVLLGQTPTAIARADGAEMPQVPALPSALPSSLLRRRPDIVAAEDNLVAADHALDAARAAFMPDLQLSASYGSVTTTLIHDNPLAIFALGGSLLAPIFDSGRLKAQEGSVAARRDQAAFAYRKTVLQGFSEVEDALAGNQRLREQYLSLEGQRAALQRNLDFASARFRAGYAPYLDQIDAQRGLLGAELSLVQSRADELIACVSLYQSLGGGWDRSAIEAAPKSASASSASSAAQAAPALQTAKAGSRSVD